MGEEQIPAEFQSLLDKLVETASRDDHLESPPEGLQDLDAWFIEDGYALLLETWSDEFRLDLVHMANSVFNDEEMVEFLDHDGSEEIDDSSRLVYCRERLGEADADLLSQYVFTPHWIPIESSSGISAHLGCIAQVNTLVGVAECECLGVFTNKEEFLHHLDEMGVIRLCELGKIDDEFLLGLWEQDGRKVRMQSKHPLIGNRLSC